MVDIPGATAGEGASFMDAIQEQMTNALGVDEVLKELAQKDPDAFMAKLGQIRKDYREFYTQEGEIKLDVMKSKLSWQERMSLFASHYISENIIKSFFASSGEEKVSTLSFPEVLKFYEAKEGKGAKARDGHLIWQGANNPLSQISAVFSFAEMFSATTSESKDPFPIPPQSRLVVQARPASGPKYTPTLFTILKSVCASKGILLNLVKPGETLHAPDAKEIQLVMAPAEGLPLTSDGKINKEEVKWFQNLYEENVPAQWVMTPALLSAVYVSQGKSVEEALALTELSTADASFKELLAELVPTPETPKTA